MSAPTLPPNIDRLLRKDFSDRLPEAQDLLLGVVRACARVKDLERILLDIVSGAEGDFDKLERFASLAKRDWRDLIMATEYELVDKKIVRKKNRPDPFGA